MPGFCHTCGKPAGVQVDNPDVLAHFDSNDAAACPHEGEPLTPAELAEKSCDFCLHIFAAGEGRFMYDVGAAVLTTSVGGAGERENGFSELWIACDPCAEEIRTGNRRRLAIRFVDSPRASILKAFARDAAIEKTIDVHAQAFWKPWLEVRRLAHPVRRFD